MQALRWTPVALVLFALAGAWMIWSALDPQHAPRDDDEHTPDAQLVEFDDLHPLLKVVLVAQLQPKKHGTGMDQSTMLDRLGPGVPSSPLKKARFHAAQCTRVNADWLIAQIGDGTELRDERRRRMGTIVNHPQTAQGVASPSVWRLFGVPMWNKSRIITPRFLAATYIR